MDVDPMDVAIALVGAVHRRVAVTDTGDDYTWTPACGDREAKPPNCCYGLGQARKRAEQQAMLLCPECWSWRREDLRRG